MGYDNELKALPRPLTIGPSGNLGRKRFPGGHCAMRARISHWVGLMALIACLAPAFVVAAPQPARALSASAFDAGFIISNGIFGNSASMSEAQIQSFLEAAVPNCVGANGVTCLRNYTTDSISRDPSPGGQCNGYLGAAGERASRIIFKVAQSCRINPQVLIVMLQKEQGLITAVSPGPSKYRIAMGYGCPDTAPCDAQYYGFANQVYKAAWQLREYVTNPGYWRYKVGVIPVQWHPSAACGAPLLNIRSAATAALYNYTPYQPNAAAMANLSGSGDACSSYGNRNFWVYFSNWFGSPIGLVNPVGRLDALAPVPGGVYVAGWAFDPDTTGPINVQITVNGVVTAFLSTNDRPDLVAAFGDVGSAHGFDLVVPVTSGDPQTVCVYGMNYGPGADSLIEGTCSTLPSFSGSPFGYLDSVTAAGGAITASGWTIDPDSAAPIGAHIYVDNVPVAIIADKPRPDIGAQFPLYGPPHGFTTTIPASPGPHTVCAFGINVGFGSNSILNCKPIVVQTGAPFGVADVLTASSGVVMAAGWAIDPDTVDPIVVQLSIDANVVATIASNRRDDIADVFPGYGPSHGFRISTPATPGVHRICVTAIGVGSGGSGQLKCITDSSMSGSPFGFVDSTTVSPSMVTVRGWSIDPDIASAVSMRVTVDGVATAFTADRTRADVGQVYGLYGAGHGFDQTVRASAGTRQVCVTAVNVAAGTDTLLGCSRVVVGP